MSALPIPAEEFTSPEALAKGFAQWSANLLQGAVEQRGAALLIVSGGETPKRFFTELAVHAIDWARVSITLADERCVADDNLRSNARLLREHLLQGPAAAAAFTPLADSRLTPQMELVSANARIARLPLPADLAILGMGEDGHTASWFPGADNLAQAIDPGARSLVLPIEAPGAAEPRLTLTARVLLRAKTIALHIEGESKSGALAKALAPGPIEEMPIRAVLRGAPERLHVFWAPKAAMALA